MNPFIQASEPNHRKALQLFRENMLVFGKVCLPSMFTVKSPPFHKEMAAYFHDPGTRRLNIIAPRGHAKSSLAGCLWVLHHLFFDPGPQKFIVLVSKTEGHAVRLVQTIKDALNFNSVMRRYVGYWGEFSAKVWKTSEIILKDNSMIMARGTGQQVVGLKHVNQRPTLIILDDPEDMMNTKTAEAMEFNLRWLLQSLIPALDPKVGRVAVIGTPQHQRCMVEVLKGAKNWKSLTYKAIQDDGTALWPEWMPVAKLMDEKEAMESIGKVSSWYREYQCQVIGDDDQLFKPEYIQYYEGALSGKERERFLEITSKNGVLLPVPEKVPVTVFMGIDPASSTSETADFSVCMVVAVDARGNRYVLEYYRKRVTPLTLADAIVALFDRYRPSKTRVEVTGYQEMLREYLRSKKYIPGLEIREMPRQKKSHRLEMMQPHFAQKKVYLRKEMRELIDELIMYPRSKHDDLLDGLYYAFKGVYGPQHTLASAKTPQKSPTEKVVYDWIVMG